MAHRWKFYRAGGVDQVRIETPEDLLALGELDQKLWVALSSPTRGLRTDERTLSLMDTDQDGRIRVPEILSAVRWTCAMLKDPQDIFKAPKALALASINDATPEGAQILSSAREILRSLGKQAEEITVEDVADTRKIFAETRLNGDGIILPESADEPETRAAIEDVMKCVDPCTDRSGKPGLSQAGLDAFFKDAEAWLAWWDSGRVPDKGVFVLGDATAAAFDAFAAVRAKVDDYFARCRLAAFDERALEALNRSEKDYLAVAAQDLSVTSQEISVFPLARVQAGRPLPLRDGLNPFWEEAVAALRDRVVAPILGVRDELSREDWLKVQAAFKPYETWQAAKPPSRAADLGESRLRQVASPAMKAKIEALIAADKAKEGDFSAIVSVERLIRYERDLFTVLNNFVSFRDFYSRRKKASFQAGTLYLDRRSCDLCVRVDDPAKHAALAGLSRTCLAYCDCTRRGAADKMTIAAAFTDGDSDALMVGRNGIFYDRDGCDWDATIVKLVESPISIRQAFWSPYKRIGKMVHEQIEKFAAGREKLVQDKAAAGVADAAAKQEAGKPAAAPAFDIAKFAGVFAAIGLALGALGTAVAAIVTGFLKLSWWQMPLALAGILLVISGPSMIIAWLKLRQRNLGPILDANGWAVNARVLINMAFGRRLTAIARLPRGAKRSLRDPYAERRFPWLTLIILLALLGGAIYVLNDKGYVHKWTGYGKKVEQTRPAPETAPPAPPPAKAPEGPAEPKTK